MAYSEGGPCCGALSQLTDIGGSVNVRGTACSVTASLHLEVNIPRRLIGSRLTLYYLVHLHFDYP